MYTHYYNDLEGPNRQSLNNNNNNNNNNNEVTYRTARNFLALKNQKGEGTRPKYMTFKNRINLAF